MRDRSLILLAVVAYVAFSVWLVTALDIPEPIKGWCPCEESHATR